MKLFLLTILVLLLLTESKLYQVVSAFRHGARYHLNSLYDGNSTIDVWGQITPVGMRQHQNFGKILSNQYIQNLKFLNEKYNKKEIQVFSTDLNRTIASAMSQLYGLYPPGNGPKLQYVQRKYHMPPFTNQTDIQEQNFAFPQGHQHIIINFDDKLLVQIENCPKLKDLQSQNLVIHSQEYQQMNLTYYPFIKKCIQIFDLPSNSTLQTLSSLFGNLNVDKFLGRPLPEGFSQNDYQNIKHLHDWMFNVKYSGTSAKVVTTAKFAKIIKQFDARINNLTAYPLKWTFLSCHDTDLAPLQMNLNISSYQCIEQFYRKGKTDALNCKSDVSFASSLIFELHSDNDKDFYVMIRFQGQYVYLCQKKLTKCPYNQFKLRLKAYYLNNVNEICGWKS